MTTTAWQIVTLDREIADGYVFTAHWTVNATEETYSAGAYGSIGFERPENLVPYDELTEELVVGWVKEEMTAEKVTEIENGLQAQLDKQKTPTTAEGTPWS